MSQGVQGVQSAPPEKKLTGKIGKAKGKSGRQRKERKGKEKTKRKAKGIWKGKEKKEKGRHANKLENCIFYADMANGDATASGVSKGGC